MGWSALSKLDAGPATEATLEVMQIDRWLSELAAVSGAGSAARRHELLRTVFELATEREQRLLRGVFGGELRQGALDGVMVEAIAKGAGIPIDEVRRAHMLSGDLGETGRLAFGAPTAEARVAAMHSVTLRPGRAVEPMLASPAADVAEALTLTGEASVEWKLDGARVQAHRRGRRRAAVHAQPQRHDRPPRQASSTSCRSALPGGDLVLDGEVLGVLDDGAPRRFQDTMGDFGADTPGRGSGLGAVLLRRPPYRWRRRRRRAAAPCVGSCSRRPCRASPGCPRSSPPTRTRRSASSTTRSASGHEGVMVKDLAATYDAGRRGGAWRKVKPVHTLDLVVHRRRVGPRSAHRAGCRTSTSVRGGATAEFVMVGKTFKGMTDDCCAGRPSGSRNWRSLPRATSSTSGPSRSSRSPSTASRHRRAIPARSRCVSPGCAATATTSRPADADTIEHVQALLR